MAKAKDVKNQKAAPAEGEIVETKPKRGRPAKTQALVHGPDTAIVAGVTTEQLKQALTVQTEQRGLIKEFIRDHLVDGTDFGKIHINKTCPNKYDTENCKAESHFSKAVLFKPGQEKIFSLFNLTNELVRDDEAMEMLAGTKGLVAYKCIVYRGDKKVGEGRGAAIVGDRSRDVNATIKIAEKRARMDACLSLGFSEYFAQDLDDPDYQDKIRMEGERSKAAEEAARANAPASKPERFTLLKRMQEKGYATSDQQVALLGANGIADPKSLTSAQAREMIRKLVSNAYEIPDTVVDDAAGDDDIANDMLDDDSDPPAKAPPPEAELVVDDDLRSAVQERVEQMGLNAQGIMWFKKRATGKPFAKWENFGDADWIGAYNTLQAIEDSSLEVPDHLILGYVGEEGADEPAADDSDQSPVDFSESSNADEKDAQAVQELFPGAEVIDKTPERAGKGA